MSETKFLTAAQVAEYYNITLAHVYKLVNRKMIPFRKLGGSLRFDAAEVEEWTKQTCKKPPKKTTSDRPVATPASLLALQHELYPSSRR